MTTQAHAHRQKHCMYIHTAYMYKSFYTLVCVYIYTPWISCHAFQKPPSPSGLPAAYAPISCRGCWSGTCCHSRPPPDGCALEAAEESQTGQGGSGHYITQWPQLSATQTHTYCTYTYSCPQTSGIFSPLRLNIDFSPVKPSINYKHWTWKGYRYTCKLTSAQPSWSLVVLHWALLHISSSLFKWAPTQQPTLASSRSPVVWCFTHCLSRPLACNGKIACISWNKLTC